jgi:hypothetical protein
MHELAARVCVEYVGDLRLSLVVHDEHITTRLELLAVRVDEASGHHDEWRFALVSPEGSVHCVSTLSVALVGDRTGIEHVNIGVGTVMHDVITAFVELCGDRFHLVLVELTAEAPEGNGIHPTPAA